eukprot:12734427-Ditylum_brightwellii.AAC.1
MMSRRPCISGGGRAVMEEEQPQEREGEVGQEEDINELRGLGFEGRGLPYERSIPRTVAAHQDEDLSYCEEEIDEDDTIDLQDNKTNPCVDGDATEEGDEEEMTMFFQNPNLPILPHHLFKTFTTRYHHSKNVCRQLKMNVT